MMKALWNGYGAKNFMFLFSIGGVIMSIFYILVIILAAYLVYKIFTVRVSEKEIDEAQRILRERYAKGEISEEEYDKMKSKLNKE